jgi:hypothetical protein
MEGNFLLLPFTESAAGVYRSGVALQRFWFFGLSAALLVGVLGGCHESSGAQPSSLGAEPVAAPKQPAAPAPTLAAPTPASAGAAGASQAGAAESEPSVTEKPELGPALLDAQGNALAQTEARPTLTSPSFRQRLAVLAQAIVNGDAEPASAAFFPLAAYRQVKDVAKPERDYRFRLLAHFKRDVAEYHRALGSAAADAKFQGIVVPEQAAKWMPPGTEGNKVGYFRVLRSRLHFTLPTGRSRDFELTSLISWRGEWYVVHLHGFK